MTPQLELVVRKHRRRRLARRALFVVLAIALAAAATRGHDGGAPGPPGAAASSLAACRPAATANCPCSGDVRRIQELLDSIAAWPRAADGHLRQPTAQELWNLQRAGALAAGELRAITFCPCLVGREQDEAAFGRSDVWLCAPDGGSR